MEILHFDEVDESEMTELMLACFDHAYSREHIREMIKADRRMPGWGGELYAEEDDKLLGSIGLLYPRAKISGEVRKVGGIRNVCSRPSESRRGVVKQLLERVHEIMRDEVELSFLMTSKSGVAYNLYRKFGYETVHIPPRAYKKVEDRETDIEFRDEKDPEYVRSLYMDSVEGLSGLVVREEDYFDTAEARDWPDNDNLRIAYKDGEKIGYAMYESSRKSLTVKEFAAKDGRLEALVKAFEEVSDKDYIVLSYVNPSYTQLLRKVGYSWYDDLWYRVMVKSLDVEREKIMESRDEETFHAGVYELY